MVVGEGLVSAGTRKKAEEKGRNGGKKARESKREEQKADRLDIKGHRLKHAIHGHFSNLKKKNLTEFTMQTEAKKAKTSCTRFFSSSAASYTCTTNSQVIDILTCSDMQDKPTAIGKISCCQQHASFLERMFM